LRKVSTFGGGSETKREAAYLMKIFEYMGSKSSRDFLMELGMVRDAVALDVRVQNTLRKKIGIRIPKGLENNPEKYDDVEHDLLIKICQPLRMSGVEFDRMLYQSYDQINAMTFR